MLSYCLPLVDIFFFFNDTATTEIYTLSLHDALPISFEHIDLEVEAVHRHDVAHLVDGAMRAVLGQQRLGIGQRDPVFEFGPAHATCRALEREKSGVSGDAHPHPRSEEHTSELQSQSN